MELKSRRTKSGSWSETDSAASTAAPRLRSVRRPGKRLLDVVLAATGLIAVSPLLLVIAVAIKATSPGGVLFRQTRVGYLGREFVMYKFRTMYVGAPDDSHREYVTSLLADAVPEHHDPNALFKLHADPRVTRVGRLLRRWSLDELPQLINVLRGEMSLVGPRPALHYEVELFDIRHLERFLVPPGVTGLWQVSGRSRLTMRQALDLDVEYVRRRSMGLDLLILLKTLPCAIRGTDAA
jgi:lipopolysaccharide/colanic/teichoic acid biosynthesis glycosyltransferase